MSTTSPAKKKVGRPRVYTKALAAEICKRLASGETLRAICRDEGMPSRPTVHGWIIDDVQGFSAQYTRARELGYDEMADETITIADTPTEGVRIEKDGDGTKEVREDMLGHRKLRVDTRKWLLSKLAPRKYGDNRSIDLTVKDSLAERLARARARDGK
jgi:hypothetical protein